MRQLLLERRALARVAAVEHDAADVLVVAEVGRDDLELERASVAVNERAVERLRARRAVARRLQQLPQPPAVACGAAGPRTRVPATSSAVRPRMRWIDGLWYSTCPSRSTTVIRSLAFRTSDAKRASFSRRCACSLSAALSSARETLAQSASSASTRIGESGVGAAAISRPR